MSLPHIQLYPGDWLRDRISLCSLAAQGLWLRMMYLMHDSERYGYLCVNGKPFTDEAVARGCGTTVDQYLTLLKELDDMAIPSRTEQGVIYCRRMVRDASISKSRSKAGRKGGYVKHENESGKSLAKVWQNTDNDNDNDSDVVVVESIESPKDTDSTDLFGNKIKSELKVESNDEYLKTLQNNFETWYAEYPRKQARGAAFRAFGTALKKTSLDTLLAATKKFKRLTADREREFIPYPASWLNQERWTDVDTDQPVTTTQDPFDPNWKPTRFAQDIDDEAACKEACRRWETDPKYRASHPLPDHVIQGLGLKIKDNEEPCEKNSQSSSRLSA